MPSSEMGESRGYDDYDENGDSDWIPKEPMIKFKDLEDEEELDREVSCSAKNCFVRKKDFKFEVRSLN